MDDDEHRARGHCSVRVDRKMLEGYKSVIPTGPVSDFGETDEIAELEEMLWNAYFRPLRQSQRHDITFLRREDIITEAQRMEAAEGDTWVWIERSAEEEADRVLAVAYDAGRMAAWQQFVRARIAEVDRRRQIVEERRSARAVQIKLGLAGTLDLIVAFFPLA